MKAFPPNRARLGGPVLEDVTQLGPRGALYLLAAMRAHSRHKRLAPTDCLSDSVLIHLDVLGVVDAHASDHSTQHPRTPPTVRYTWNAYPEARVCRALQTYLSGLRARPELKPLWLELWRALHRTEIEAMFWRNLARRNLPERFITSLTAAVGNIGNYSLGQWQPALRSTVQSMACAWHAYPGNAEFASCVLAGELPRRLAASRCEWRAFPTQGRCTLASCLATAATSMGPDYWRCVPALERC